MSRVFLTKLKIKNLGPIEKDEVIFEPFTYFVGRNNAGKSHYLKAIEILLATRAPSKDDIIKLQHNKTQDIIIEGIFKGVQNFTSLVSTSKHKVAIDEKIQGEELVVVRKLNQDGSEFGLYNEDGTIYNPVGFPTNLLKILPEPIHILATADTVDELKNKQNTALSKLKKEVLSPFFRELKDKTKQSLTELDDFLHGESTEQRSRELADFELHLKEELMGEFADVNPSVKFDLPTEEVIAKEMKIFLDDGYESEIEQKGHGLQRAALLAMLKVLAKHGNRYQDRPSPIFLIGELESFLHPYAQKQFAEVLETLAEQYQVVTTTHSPFIITSKSIEGYRRIKKDTPAKSKSVRLGKDNIDIKSIKHHLESRGNLEGLFADRIVLIEGKHDEGFYYKLMEVFNIKVLSKKCTIFVKVSGSKQSRPVRNFYKQMKFDDVSVILDLDYLFSKDFKHLLKDIDLDEQYYLKIRQHIGLSEEDKDMKKEKIACELKEKGYPLVFDEILDKLEEKRIFILKHGAPENYYTNDLDQKDGWLNIKSESDLLEPTYLKQLMEKVLN